MRVPFPLEVLHRLKVLFLNHMIHKSHCNDNNNIAFSVAAVVHEDITLIWNGSYHNDNTVFTSKRSSLLYWCVMNMPFV